MVMRFTAGRAETAEEVIIHTTTEQFEIKQGWVKARVMMRRQSIHHNRRRTRPQRQPRSAIQTDEARAPQPTAFITHNILEQFLTRSSKLDDNAKT